MGGLTPSLSSPAARSAGKGIQETGWILGQGWFADTRLVSWIPFPRLRRAGDDKESYFIAAARSTAWRSGPARASGVIGPICL